MTKKQKTKRFIPVRFQERVTLHLLDNNSGEPGTPLVQLWHGAAGEGKTSGISEILTAHKAEVFTFGGADFESEEAGRPGDVFQETFETALAALHRLGEATPVAVLINDLDLGIGDLGANVQYTVNRQHLTVSLMDLCDRYSGWNRRPRPAVYVTANRPEVLHAPLTRDGRCETLRWSYHPAEREEIVGRIYPHLTPYYIQLVVEHFPGEPIAFFAGLKRLARRSAALTQLRQVTTKRAVALAVAGQWRVAAVEPRVEELIALGDEVLSNRSAGISMEEMT
jgi:ATPase family associated with various cellular activities (AAA)